MPWLLNCLDLGQVAMMENVVHLQYIIFSTTSRVTVCCVTITSAGARTDFRGYLEFVNSGAPNEAFYVYAMNLVWLCLRTDSATQTNGLYIWDNRWNKLCQ